MKKIHIHIAVDDIDESIRFYSSLFDAQPSKRFSDYAKWQLDSPSINFAISSRGHQLGVNHLGIEVDSEIELDETAMRLEQAGFDSFAQQGVSCCYSLSNKHWNSDPQSIRWETFRSLADEDASECCIPLVSNESDSENVACCVPNENNTASGCCK